MRSGNWRGVLLGLGLAAGLILAAGGTRSAHAQVHTIPRLVPAMDLNTGGPYYAPPVPAGHYTGKNHVAKLCGKVGGLLHGGGLLHHGGGCGPCGACGGKGCGACGNTGDACGGNGGGHGLGLGHKFGHGNGCGGGCGDPGCGGTVQTVGCPSGLCASAQGVPTPQFAGDPCGDPGCGLFGKHHRNGDPGCSLFGKHRGNGGDPCNSCGGKGCGLCGGLGKLCNLCGGMGCSACAKARGLVGHLLGHDKIKWFKGAGGPVPLTPGYVPYVNVTRSPRDFFAFPPMTP